MARTIRGGTLPVKAGNSRLRDAAPDYLDRGWRLIAKCRNSDGQRKPILGLSPYDASSCADRVDRWLRVPWTQAIAVLAGEASGVFGLDADVKDGKDGVVQLHELFRAHDTSWSRMVFSLTPSGGRHVLFRWDQRLAEVTNHSCLLVLPGHRHGRAIRREGLELKVRGKLLTLPPSDYGDGPYRWAKGHSPLDLDVPEAPASLLDFVLDPPLVQAQRRLDARRAAELRRRGVRRRGGPDPGWLRRDVQRCCTAIACLGPGSQHSEANKLLFVLALKHGTDVLDHFHRDLKSAVLQMRQGGRPWTHADAERLVRNALRDGGAKHVRGT